MMVHIIRAGGKDGNEEREPPGNGESDDAPARDVKGMSDE